MQVVAEFTIEPSDAGRPGPHVVAGMNAVRAAGFEPDVEPSGASVTGELDLIAPAVADLLHAASRAGATKISLELRRV